MSTHPAYLNLDSDEAEAVLDAAEKAAGNPETYGCTPNECATTPSRHCCIPWGKEGVVAALNDLGVVLRWETLADRDAFAEKEATR